MFRRRLRTCQLLGTVLLAAPVAAECPDQPEVLCLGERFAVEVAWEDLRGQTASAENGPHAS